MSNSASSQVWNQVVRKGRGSVTDKSMKCPKCDVTVVPKKDEYLACKLCDSVWHKQCLPTALDEETFQLLKRNEKKDLNLYWYCTKQCDRAAAKFLSGMAYLEEEVTKTKEKVGVIENKVENIREGKFSEKMTEKVKTIAQEMMQATGAADVEEIVNTKAKEQLAEAENRAKRQTNLIIFKLPESKKPNNDDRKKEDRDKIINVLTECEINHELVDTTRLGKASKDGDRPTRLTFVSQAARDNTLSNLIKKKRSLLGQDSDSQLLTLGFRKDMTPKERKEEEELYKIIKQKREESKASGDDTARWVVRNGQVVNLIEWKAARKEEEDNKQA